MPGLNKVILIGYIDSKPFIRTSLDGTASLIFSLLTVDTTGKEGHEVKRTERHQIAYQPNAEEFLNKCLLVEELMYVEGKIRTSMLIDFESNLDTPEVEALHVKVLDY